MSGIRKISELSKEELLSFIYNNLKNTRLDDHPFRCASCGDSPDELVTMADGMVAKVYWYCCDKCEDNGLEY